MSQKGPNDKGSFDGYIEDYITGELVRDLPEEREAVQVFSKILVEDYGYPKEHIATHPQYRVKARPSDTKKEYPVDIAVFTEDKFCDDNAHIIVECKKKNRVDGRSQLEDYLRFSKCQLGVWYNGSDRAYIRKYESRGKVTFHEIPNIPKYGQRVEDVGLFERKDLVRTHNLKATFRSIRNYLAANNTGSTLDTEFTPQIINLVFCKIYDERYTLPNEMVSFRAGIDEKDKDVVARINELFKKVKGKYSDVIEPTEKIKLSSESVVYIVGELQQYCLIESERDVIADAFETFIGPSLRGTQGQFFTPRNVVNLAITLTDPTRDDKIIDPACGSGGFLIESLRHVWRNIEIQGKELHWPDEEIRSEKQEAAIKNFRGIDKEGFLAKVAKAYMAILGDGRGGIFNEDSLCRTSQWSSAARDGIPFGDFDIVMTNPPFGSKLKVEKEKTLKDYELGYKWKKNNDANCFEKTSVLLEGQTPQVLFIERCLKMLKDNGRMGVILPESMFCNPSHQYIMAFIEKHARIKAIVSLPEELFQPHTHAKTCVVLIEKGAATGDYDIFMSIAKWCGHDSRGLEIPFDDIPLIQDRYRRFLEGEELEYDHLGFLVKRSDINNSIYLPKYYNPEIANKLASIEDEYDLCTFSSLVEAGFIELSTGNEVGKLAYGTGNYPFIRSSDIAGWEIKLDPKQGLSKEIYLKYKEKQDVKPYDIFMVRDGTYLVGTCAMVLPSDTQIVYQSHIYKIRSLDHEYLSPYLLIALLSSPIVKEQIRSKQFTQDIIDTLGKRIGELILPIPKSEDKKNEIIHDVKLIFEKRTEARVLLRNTLMSVTPLHDFDGEDDFMTLR